MTQKQKDNILATAVLLGAVAVVVACTWIFGGYGLIFSGTTLAYFLNKGAE